MQTTFKSLVAGLALAAGACSSPSDNNKVIIDDADMASPNNGADAQTLDVNNGLQPDTDINEGCQVGGCPDDQVCNMATGICVDCVTNAECGANGLCDPVSNKCSCATGFHACNGVCSADDSVESCGSSCTPCATDPNGTTSCTAGQCGLSCNAPLILEPGTNSCVGCTANVDCMGAGASVCGAGGSCESCTDAAGCSHVTGAPICDAGTCVECSTADDSACGGSSCDPFTGTCTSTPKASVAECGPCLADSECTSGYACVPMEFQGDVRSGGFCLPIDNGGCTTQLAVSVARTSLSGVAGNYCTVNETLTTCEGVKDYGAPCGDASDCGVDGLDDGVCEPIDFDVAACTYVCDDSAQCPAFSVMGCASGNVGMKWCGAY